MHGAVIERLGRFGGYPYAGGRGSEMELRGLEPLTSSLPARRSSN